MSAQMNVPKLRFPEFSMEWEEKRLGEVTTYVDYRGRAPTKTEEGHFLVTAKNIKKGFIDYECSKEYVAENDYLNVMSKGLPEIGDVLFTTEAPMGNVAQVDDKNIALAQRVIKFRSKKMLSNLYLLHYMLSAIFQKSISEKSIGTTVQGISGKELHRIRLAFPSLHEQQKIASFLSAVDTKINQLTHKKELIEQYKKGVMQKIFSQELRFKTDDGSEFPEWEEKKLGEISNVKDGTHDSPKYTNVGYPLLTSKNLLTNGKLDFENINLISEEDYISINKRSKVDIGDILFGMIGTIGNPVLIQEDGFAIKNVALIKEKDTLLNIFLIHYLKSIHLLRQFYQQNTGGTQKFIALGVIRDFLISVPCIDEQTKIADFLSAIDSKIDLVTKQLNEAKNFKKGLLQQMFV